MKNKRIAIIGSGDLGQSIAHYAKNNDFEVVGFYDDFTEQKQIAEIPILGKLSQIPNDYNSNKFDALVCAVGYKHFGFRESVFQKFHEEYGIPFATIVDKSCHIDETATLGEGVVIFPTSVVDKGVTIDDNVLLNVGVTIAHDSHVKSHSFLSPRVAIAGFSTVGKRCFVGINTTIIDNITISDDIRIGGGNLVIISLLEPGLYVGNPVKWKKL